MKSTNGRVKSTPHRGLPPVGRHRCAIPFFLGPHIDTVIANYDARVQQD